MINYVIYNVSVFVFVVLLCPYRWLPLAKLINVSDINMVMAPIATTFVDYHRKQLIAVITFLSISLMERKKTFINDINAIIYAISQMSTMDNQ